MIHVYDVMKTYDSKKKLTHILTYQIEAPHHMKKYGVTPLVYSLIPKID